MPHHNIPSRPPASRDTLTGQGFCPCMSDKTAPVGPATGAEKGTKRAAVVSARGETTATFCGRPKAAPTGKPAKEPRPLNAPILQKIAESLQLPLCLLRELVILLAGDRPLQGIQMHQAHLGEGLLQSEKGLLGPRLRQLLRGPRRPFSD